MASVYRNVFGMTTAVSAALLMASVAGAQVNPEVEPNDNKSQATVANSGGAGMAAGDTITGTTTGTSTVTAGLGSADYFRVKTAAMPLGIYRHRLQLTSTTLGQTGTIRGLTTTANSALGGTINVTTDATFQTAPTTLTNGVPIRTNQWYGFGKQEEIYYRVTGLASTTAAYTSTLSTVPVTAVNMGNVLEGNVTVARAAGNTADIDFWVYNSNLDPIANFGKDSPEPASVTMALTPGVYYIMAGGFNTANNQAPPIGETFAGSVLDFPNAAANSSTAIGTNLAMTVTGALGSTATGVETRTEGFQAVWYTFTVDVNTNPVPPGGVGSVAPTAGLCNDGSASTQFNVVVTPGVNPVSTGITVTADLSTLGGSATAALLDDGANGDGAAGDNNFGLLYTIPAGTAPGAYNTTFTVSDAELRSSGGAFTPINVISPALPPATVENLGDLSLPVQGTRTFDLAATEIRWYAFSLSSTVSTGAGTFLDFDTVNSLNCPDTEIAVYRTDCAGNLVSSDDDSGPGLESALSYGAGVRPAVTQAGCSAAGTTYAGGLTLTPGNYLLAVSGFSTTHGAAGYSVVSTSVARPGITINYRSTVTPSNPVGTGTAIPATVLNDGTGITTLRVAVTPGQFPVSTGVTVSVNAAAIGAGTVVLLDDGVAPDTTANDGIFNASVTVANGTAAGALLLPFTVNDAEMRSSMGNIALTTREASGACCVPGSCSITTLSACNLAEGTFLGDGSACAQEGTYAIIGSANTLEDISATGTVINAAPGDDATFPVTLSFPFPFYGVPQNTCNVSTNGNIQFPPVAPSTTFTNTDIPAVAAPNNALYVCWDDFNFAINTTDGLFTETRGTAGVDLRQIIQWNNVAEFGSATDTNFNTFQAVLFENGTVEYRYGTMSGTIFAANDSTIGVENAGGTAATQLDETLIGSNTAVAVVYSNGVSNCPSGCAPDFNGDGTLDPDDLADYIGAYFSVPAPLTADFNGDGTVDPDDLADYIGAYFAGCP